MKGTIESGVRNGSSEVEAEAQFDSSGSLPEPPPIPSSKELAFYIPGIDKIFRQVRDEPERSEPESGSGLESDGSTYLEFPGPQLYLKSERCSPLSDRPRQHMGRDCLALESGAAANPFFRGAGVKKKTPRLGPGSTNSTGMGSVEGRSPFGPSPPSLFFGVKIQSFFSDNFQCSFSVKLWSGRSALGDCPPDPANRDVPRGPGRKVHGLRCIRLAMARL